MRGVDYSADWFCGPGGMYSFGHFGGIFHLIFWGVLLFILYKVISHLFSEHSSRVTSTGGTISSMDILEKRYASGEIDQEEFLRRKKDLGG